MKTHDVARALVTLSKLLRSGPNVELSELSLPSGPLLHPGDLSTKAGQEQQRVNLLTLVALAGQPKSHWLKIIEEYQLPVRVRTRDSAREIMWAVVKYLLENEGAREKLKEEGRKTKASPELMNALKSLLDV